MKKIRNFVIGGIESKIFNLILITVILITGAGMAAIHYQSTMLSQLTADTNQRQQEDIAETTAAVMDTVVKRSMDVNTALEARITDEVFRQARAQITLVAEYAAMLFSDPDGFQSAPYTGPDPNRDGTLSAMVLYAPGVDASDPAVAARVGLAANLSDVMISLCDAFGSDNAYIGLKEGVFLYVSKTSGSWFLPDGTLKSYDVCGRFWYQQAAEAGELVFTDVETDANTGELSLVCAMPVYDDEGALQAVVGTDMFLYSMREYLDASQTEGSYRVVVNQSGHAIFSQMPWNEFQVNSSGEAEDLRLSPNADLAALIADALAGKTDVRLIDLSDGRYYIMGVPMENVGWTLISIFEEDRISQPVDMLLGQYRQTLAEARGTYQEKNEKLKTNVQILLGGLLLVLLASAVFLGKRIVKPLNTITQRISELREGNLEFKMEDAYRTGDEIQVLAESFASLSHKTLLYVDEVKRSTAEKERIGTELHMATLIQESMLPHVFPPFPERKEFDLFASMDPAREVGGDFYDFFLIDDDHICLVMADVSGKGVPGALFMMISKVILQSCAMLGRSAGEILTKTNEALCSNNKVEMFVTVWLGIMEISTGKIIAANAGHEYPVIRRKDGAFQVFRDKHGFVVGGMEGLKYKEYELQLHPGDKLFLYTDGVPEATNANGKLFGMDRTVEALNACAPESTPKEILAGVRRAVDAFVGEAEQFDDLTMLCLEYRGVGTEQKEEKQ